MPNLRVLVILMGSLGDVIRGLCVANALKSLHPNCEITWLIESSNRVLVDGHESIDRVIEFKRHQFVGSFFSVLKQLRGVKFDYVLDMQRIFKSGLFSWLSGGRRRIGFHKQNSKEFNWLFNTDFVDFVDQERTSKVLHYMRFVKSIDAMLSPAKLSSKKEEQPVKFGLEFLVKEYKGKFCELRSGYVALLLGSRWETKNWERDGYHQLLKLIMERTDKEVVLVGDRSSLALADELQRSFETPRMRCLVAETSLIDLAWVLKNAAVCVGPDSGPGHLAAALGVGYITLFGPTSAARVAPWGMEELAISANAECSPCGLRKCPGFDKLCMRLISAEKVFGRLMAHI